MDSPKGRHIHFFHTESFNCSPCVRASRVQFLFYTIRTSRRLKDSKERQEESQYLSRCLTSWLPILSRVFWALRAPWTSMASRAAVFGSEELLSDASKGDTYVYRLFVALPGPVQWSHLAQKSWIHRELAVPLSSASDHFSIAVEPWGGSSPAGLVQFWRACKSDIFNGSRLPEDRRLFGLEDAVACRMCSFHPNVYGHI
ncbi:hypothetical protein B0T10DRAFT_592859 [Thelonectria olida]|uniref:Uncharacterized protein n=1 Tax=Thelonectria olida TaxID=1576542 RepID=A0A9P9AI61_9HYPO|nr:hypothetical protein B0T10DRAFT_592859 [Thelonectria olida]